ncbi:MAG TPA: hypothetical protein VNG89_05575 [Vicinamibacterales bacterium]|nr:hypothetical protein [Vicinamibacterales bacterium]
MGVSYRCAIVAALVIAGALPARGQSVPDPSGHWQGSVQAPGMQIPLEVDLAKGANGEFDGTLTAASQKIKGLPLIRITVEGGAVAFQARSDQPFTGVLSDDRQSITGNFLVSGNSLPFALTRTGDASIRPVPASARIPAALEGTWTATVVADGVERRLVMTLENHADGTAGGRVVNEDEGGLVLPLTIAQQGQTITIQTLPIASTFAATLNDGATELSGTVTQGAATAHVSFRRAK